VVIAIKKVLPNERIIYFGDTARVPYGTKSAETVKKYAVQDAKFLLDQRVKAIVIACNTASAIALEEVRKIAPVPVVGVVEPSVERALEGNFKNIGIIGTPRTIKSGAFEKPLKNFNKKVLSKACPLFVPLVEEGLFEGSITRKVAKMYLKSLKREKIEALILGCTHYPFLKKIIREVVGRKVVLIDTAEEVARKLKEKLTQMDLLAEEKPKQEDKFYASDVSETFVEVAERLLGKKVVFKEIDIERY